jgi:ATP-dependent helicase Lhr and Lhr-like helicase
MDKNPARNVDVLDSFHPAVATWFRDQFGEPTQAQRLGWPVIASGQNALIVAPTGSGKTLAAFLAALDFLWRTPAAKPGVRILYISPLKALNQDVSKNLEFPLEGILAGSHAIGDPLPELRIAVRSGDTPSKERAAMVRKPPDILITTPESLHLLLTSQARETLRGISHVIVDEIHAVCGNKRGVFLALLLERLEAINARSFVRIGLSATQRPLDEVARYLGGIRRVAGTTSDALAEPRPVTIVDAGWRRDLDLEVVWPRNIEGAYSAGSVWPAIEHHLKTLVDEHRSTIVFANNRRTVEKLTARLNEADAAEFDRDDARDDSTPGDQASPPRRFRAHHGSLSLEERRGTEEALKRGELAAVVATASLELGIDMGAVDLVCQVESPGSVARGLQRVGRAGHVVRGVSKGRMIAKTPADLLETAALCRAMLRGEIEPLRVPQNCLDVLAQQVIACVAMESWDLPALFELVRRAYAFHDLSAETFENVLRLVSGRFPSPGLRDLRARVVWDRVHNRLAALPGTARLALTSGGTIPDTGQFPVYLGEGGPRLGELDEEFVYERRVGETFALGDSRWRIEKIDPHRVIVAKAEGQSAVMPFWRGEQASRSAELGEAIGALTRDIVARLGDADLPEWLERECRLTRPAAFALRNHIARQERLAGTVPDDHTILIESFLDQTGELSLAVLSPFGGKLHYALKLALSGRIRDRFGLSAACLHSDDGILFRLPMMDDPPLDLFGGLSAKVAEELIRNELAETALFGLRFRQSAARALLMPRPDLGKRSPLWLQRLRAKDLLQVARQFPDFPIVLETVRECLDDDLDLPRLKSLLDRIESGTIQVVSRKAEAPSPFASELIFEFTAAYLYEWDAPKNRDRKSIGSVVDVDLLEPLLRGENLDKWLDREAIGRVENRLRHLGRPPRTVEEMAERLRLLGDLTPSEISGPMDTFLAELKALGRAVLIELPRTAEPSRWIAAEEEPLYLQAFLDRAQDEHQATETIVRRFLQTHALIGLADLTARYPVPALEAAELLERWCEEGKIVRVVEDGEAAQPRWAERENLAEMRRVTVAARRGESLAVLPEVFADFILRRQHVHPSVRVDGPSGVEQVLAQLQGIAAPASLWETEILPRRVNDYRPAWLDAVLGQGTWHWQAQATGRDEPRVAFFGRDFPVGPCAETGSGDLSVHEQRILELLANHGASFATDLARHAVIEPSAVRRALAGLMARGLVSNDRFDPLRPGSESTLDALSQAAESRRLGQRPRAASRRTLGARAEGRWWRIESPECDAENRLLAWAGVLLDRYGVLTREVLGLEPAAPPWSEIAPVLSRAEWRGELRRGYFVEGLSGIQYADAAAPPELARLASAWLDGAVSSISGSNRKTPASLEGGFPSAGSSRRSQFSANGLVLVCAADPANIYGSGAPLDIDLLGDQIARFPRHGGNYLVMRDGRPVLIIESHGKRVSALPWASEIDTHSALSLLTSFAGPARRILKVDTYNGEPAALSPAAARLAELGFVRDYPGMTFYAGLPVTTLRS